MCHPEEFRLLFQIKKKFIWDTACSEIVNHMTLILFICLLYNQGSNSVTNIRENCLGGWRRWVIVKGPIIVGRP